MQVLDTLQKSPPLVNMILHRRADGNCKLLSEQSANQPNVEAVAKLDTQTFLATFKGGSSKHLKESEIVSIGGNRTRSSMDTFKPNLTVDSFDSILDSEEKVHKILKTPPLLPKTFHNETPTKKNAATTSARPRNRTTSVSSMNTNVSVTSPMKAVTPSKGGILKKKENDVEWFEIDLYKQNGKGLGIAVTGGPKHIISEGIKVTTFLYYLDPTDVYMF